MKNSENCEQVDLDGFERVCPIKNLSEQNGKRFIVNDVEIAVFLVNGKVYALNNICPHQHTALIYDGFIEDETTKRLDDRMLFCLMYWFVFFVFFVIKIVITTRTRVMLSTII